MPLGSVSFGRTARASALPPGVALYRLGVDGSVDLTGSDGSQRLDHDAGLLRFIDDGQRAHYLIGDADSGAARPSYATVKIGLVAPHSAFSPHVHGAEHVVLSLGQASCTLVTDGEPVELALPPGCLVRIPAMLPHAFGNRAGQPLLVVAANTGLGLADDDYAVVAEEAARRAADGDPEWAQVAAALRLLAASTPPRLGAGERLAGRLRRLAQRLERSGVR